MLCLKVDAAAVACRAIDIADECLESSLEDFKLTITDIVDMVEEDRASVEDRAVKGLYTKLLFILTRCSRLLVTEELNLFATEPRQHRVLVQSISQSKSEWWCVCTCHVQVCIHACVWVCSCGSVIGFVPVLQVALISFLTCSVRQAPTQAFSGAGRRARAQVRACFLKQVWGKWPARRCSRVSTLLPLL